MGKRNPLGLQDVADLLEKSEETRNAILVGGQALNILAVNYRCEAASSAVSEDIDFFGDKKIALAAGKAWGGKTRLATLDDATPNSAFVVVNIDGMDHQIDFMSTLIGIDMDEMQKRACIVELQNTTFRVRVMHPLHVLQSQIENVYGALNRRTHGIRTVSRSKLAVRVSRAAIVEALNKENIDESLWMAEKIVEVARSNAGLKATYQDQIEFLDAIPIHNNWPLQFIKRRRPQIQEYIGNARRKYRRQLSK